MGTHEVILTCRLVLIISYIPKSIKLAHGDKE